MPLMTENEQKMCQAVRSTATSQLIILLTDEKVRYRVMEEYGFWSRIMPMPGSAEFHKRREDGETFAMMIMTEIDRRCPA